MRFLKTSLKYKNNSMVLHYPELGKPIDVSDICATSYTKRKTFNYLYIEFNNFPRTYLRLNTTETPGKNIKITKENTVVNNSFETIRNIANNKKKPTLSSHHDLLNSYKTIYTALNQEFTWLDDKSHFIVPLKGGGVITSLFKIPEDKVLRLEAKRVPLKKNKLFSFGLDTNGEKIASIKNADEFTNALDGKDLKILEVCVATGMTTVAFLLDLYTKKVTPKKITILASAISVQGSTLATEVANHLGFKIEFITAKVTNKLANYYEINHDSLLYPNGDLLIESPWKSYDIIS